MRKLLIVDDDVNLVAYIKAVMERQPGFSLTEAHDGVAAFDAALNDPPDVVITDINMPERDGLTLLRMLKDETRTAQAKVIIMTGVPRDESRDEAMALGAAEFVCKPFSPQQIIDVIASVMDLDLTFA